eukprot:XP_001696356.1 predicted protein [Chlamydomonas reinhardtii]
MAVPCTIVGKLLKILEALDVKRHDSVSSFALPDPSEPKYIVTLAGPKGSNLAGVVSSGAEASADTGSSEAPAEPAAAARRITMTAANGRRYTCSLPPDSATGGAAATALAAAQAVAAAESSVASGSSAGSTEAQAAAVDASTAGSTAASVAADTGAAYGQKTPHELLEAMSALCLYRQEGLWTYEMCYKKHVRQFRQDASGRNEDFSCGKYTGDEEQNSSILLDASSTAVPIRYVSHVFSGGAKCTMTGAERTAEVRFTCLPDTTDNVLVSIKEFPTCNYVFVVTTPFLCKHPLFKPAADKNVAIKCEPIPSAADGEEDAAQAQESDTAAGGRSATDEAGGLGTAPPPAAAPAAASSSDTSSTCEAGDGTCSAGGDGEKVEAANKGADAVIADEADGSGAEDEDDDSEDTGTDVDAAEDFTGPPVAL